MGLKKEAIASEVAVCIKSQLDKANELAKMELIEKLVMQLPSDFVQCLHIAYSFAAMQKEGE